MKKSFIFSCSLTYLVFIFILSLAPFWPPKFWWVANCFEVLPVWLLFIPAGLLLALSFFAEEVKAVWFNVISAAMVLFWIMSFNVLSYLPSFMAKQNTFHVRVMSINMGSITDFEPLYNFILKTDPDVIAFQETGGESQDFITRDLGAKGWNSEFKEQLGIATKYKILDSDYRNRRMFGGWGAVVAYFTLETPRGKFTVFNVHLETPRKGIEPLMEQKFRGIDEMKRITEQQENESILASRWSQEFEPVMIAGDFNMLTTNPIYKKNWDRYRNVFSERGQGFGFTKHTSWHAVRIDHILVDRYWYVQRVLVGDNVKGDHRPILADVELISDYLTEIMSPKKELPHADFSKVLVSEDFETSKGDFAVGPGTVVQSERGGKERTGRVLRILSQPLVEESFISLPVAWPLEPCPTLKFFYKIPSGTSAGVRVQSEWGDWMCLAGSPSFQCPTTLVPNAEVLIDDGAWHEATIDAKALVQGLLAGVKNLKDIQFVIPPNRQQGDQFWIDDFGIYKNQ